MYSTREPRKSRICEAVVTGIFLHVDTHDASSVAPLTEEADSAVEAADVQHGLAGQVARQFRDVEQSSSNRRLRGELRRPGRARTSGRSDQLRASTGIGEPRRERATLFADPHQRSDSYRHLPRTGDRSCAPLPGMAAWQVQAGGRRGATPGRRRWSSRRRNARILPCQAPPMRADSRTGSTRRPPLK
jgi:hypothetical protein